MTPLAIIGKATLKHVNLRKEGNEDNRERAADLKIVLVTNSEVLLAFSPTVRMFLFNQDGTLRHPAVEELHWNAEAKHMQMTIMQPGRAGNSRAPLPCICCGWISTRECDWRLDSGKTCDAPLCDCCTTSPAPDKDICPAHVGPMKAWMAGRTNSTEGAGP